MKFKKNRNADALHFQDKCYEMGIHVEFDNTTIYVDDSKLCESTAFKDLVEDFNLKVVDDE